MSVTSWFPVISSSRRTASAFGSSASAIESAASGAPSAPEYLKRSRHLCGSIGPRLLNGGEERWAGRRETYGVRVEIMGPEKIRNVRKSQSLRIMNDPIISTRPRLQCCHRTHIPLIDSLASRRRRSATRSWRVVAVGALGAGSSAATVGSSRTMVGLESSPCVCLSRSPRWWSLGRRDRALSHDIS
eukprot:COSAG01_NODE_2162_length_8259_cov_2.289371_6_plen_187_part_00